MNNLDKLNVLNLFQILSPPFNYTYERYEKFWGEFYNQIKSAYENDDFNLINETCENFINLSNSHFFEPPKKLQKDLILLFYNIYTTMPIKNYLAQINASNVLTKISEKVRSDEIELPWEPIYNFTLFILVKDELSYLTKDSSFNTQFIVTMESISKFIPSSATKEIVKKIMYRISPTAIKSPLYMAFFGRLVPRIQKDYKDWFLDFISELKDTGNIQRLFAVFQVISKIVLYNSNDDFHYLIKIVMDSFTQIIINDSSPSSAFTDNNYDFLDNLITSSAMAKSIATSIVALFMSPSTRYETIQKFSSILNGAKDLFHPSISAESPTMMIAFFESFICSLRQNFKEYRQEKSQFPLENKPTSDELHLLLKPLVDIHLIMIHTYDKSELLSLMYLIRVIGEFDPSSLPRYFEFGFECIKLTDAESVAEHGWAVVTSTLIGLKQTQLFKDHIQELFSMAVNNFFVVELQFILLIFFYVLFSIFPFNKDLAPDGFEDFPFETYGVNFILAIFDAARSFPALQGKYVKIDRDYERISKMAFQTFFFGASENLLQAIHTVLVSSLSDSSLIHAFPYFSLIFNCFFVVANSNLQNSLLQAIKSHIIDNNDQYSLNVYIARYFKAASISSKSKEEFQEAVDLAISLFKHPSKKTRKAVWNSLSNAFSGLDIVAVRPKKNSELFTFQEYANELKNGNFKIYDKFPHVMSYSTFFIDYICEKLMNSKDPKEVSETLNETCSFIQGILCSFSSYIPGDDKDESPLLKFSPYYIEEVAKTFNADFEKLLKLIIYLLDNYSEQVLIVNKILHIIKTFFEFSISDLKYSTSEITFLKVFWSAKPYKDKYNIYELSIKTSIIVFARKYMNYLPLCSYLKDLICKVVKFGFSKFNHIRKNSCWIINLILGSPSFKKLVLNEFQKILKSDDPINVDEFIDFITYNGMFNLISRSENLMCQTLEFIISHIDLDNQESTTSLLSYLGALCNNIYPLGVPLEHSELWDDMLNKVVDHVENNPRKDRTIHIIASSIICISMKFIRTLPINVLQYLFETIEMGDALFSIQSLISVSSYLKRHRKTTVELKPFNSKPKIIDYAPVFDKNSKVFQHNSSIANLNSEPTPEALLQSYQTEDKELPLPDDIIALDMQSNGYHIYSDNYNVKTIIFDKNSPIIEHIPGFISASINLTDESQIASKPHFCTLWENVAKSIGHSSLQYVYELFDQLYEETLEESAANSILEFIQGYLPSLRYWSKEEAMDFIDNIIMPFVAHAVQNPNITASFSEMLIICVSSIDYRRLYPLLQFLFFNSDTTPNGNLLRKRLSQLLFTFMTCQTSIFFTSYDILWERFLDPFFNNYLEYNTSLISTLLSLYFSLVQVASYPKTSPKYSPELDSIGNTLVNKFNMALKNGDPKQKKFHQMLSVFLSVMDETTISTVERFVPLFLENIEKIMVSVNSADLSTEDFLESSFSLFLMHPVFIYNIDYTVDVIQKVIHHFDLLSSPMQSKIIPSLAQLMMCVIHSITKDNLELIYKLILDLAENTKNESVCIEIMQIIGFIMKFRAPLEKFTVIEAASKILCSMLYDEIEDQMLQAFEIVRDVIESKSKDRSTLLKTVLQQFWRDNSGHMLPRIEEKLLPYRYLTSPSYLS